MNLKPLPLLLGVIASVSITSLLSARDLHHTNESSLQISRYVDLLPGPTNAQRNPLHMVLPNVVFNHNIKSVGQAIHFLLKDTGYKLTRHHPDVRVHQMFRLPLPKIHRRMGPLTLEQALNTLSGEPWDLAIDPINRLVSFQLPDHFKQPAHMSANPAVKPLISKQVKPKRPIWNKSKVKLVQRQYKQALKPKRVHVKRKQKNSTRPPKKKIDLMTITWAELPKELR